MQCPVCQSVGLIMANRAGIEIDYCPKCRGVWLDRGELDKIVERSLPVIPTQPVGYAYQSQATYDRDYHQPHPPAYGQGALHHEGRSHRKRKQESFLSELFDFD